MRNLINNTLNKRGRLLAVLMSFAMLFCSIPNGAEAAKKKLKATSPKTVAVNKSIKIKTNMKCKFKSSNKKIATVNSKGVVKGKKAGNVKITVTAKKSKQKKILKIAVKKPCIRRKTPTPKVNETQSPQVDVTQSPKPPEEASQTPSVPGKSSDPATESPDIPKTPNPPTLTPDVPASETPSVTSTPGPIGTETPSPDLPSTPKPSVSPVPTSTATPSPTNPPLGDRTVVGIEAEPLAVYTTDDVVTQMCFIVKAKYNDGTERVLDYYEYSVEDTNESSYYLIQYGEFSTKVFLVATLTRQEARLVEPMPGDLFVSYDEGITISKLGEIPDKSNFKVQVRMDSVDGSWEMIDLLPDEYDIHIMKLEENREELLFVYTKYFSYNEKNYFINVFSAYNYFYLKE